LQKEKHKKQPKRAKLSGEGEAVKSKIKATGFSSKHQQREPSGTRSIGVKEWSFQDKEERENDVLQWRNKA